MEVAMKLGEEVYTKFGKAYKDGQVIFKEGEAGECMFIIHEGEVRITKKVQDKETTLAIFGPGEFFGEMAIIDNEPRSASATSAGDSKIIILNREVFENQIKSNPKIIMSILKKMSKRLRNADRQIKTLLMQSNSSKVAGTLIFLANRDGQLQSDGSVILDASATYQELVNMVGLPWLKIKEILMLMNKAKILNVAGQKLVISDMDDLQKFLQYLEMKEELGI
jgi:CRP-like cAMP-binding protein